MFGSFILDRSFFMYKTVLIIFVFSVWLCQLVIYIVIAVTERFSLKKNIDNEILVKESEVLHGLLQRSKSWFKKNVVIIYTLNKLIK